jgi:hypothetical protein
VPNGPPPQSAPLPGWLGPIVTLITQVGVPTVMAGVLLYFVLFRLDYALDQIEEAERGRVQMIAAMQDSTVAALDRLGERFEKTIALNIQANRELAERSRGRPD